MKFPFLGEITLINPNRFALVKESFTGNITILPKELMQDIMEVGDYLKYDIQPYNTKEISRVLIIDEDMEITEYNLKKGIEVERKEHSNANPKKIAKDHLEEDPDYYDDWEDKEKVLKKKKVPKYMEDHLPNETLGTFIIQDWAGNKIHDSDGHEMKFSSFEDGWEYLRKLHPDDEEALQEYEVVENPGYLGEEVEDDEEEEEDEDCEEYEMEESKAKKLLEADVLDLNKGKAQDLTARGEKELSAYESLSVVTHMIHFINRIDSMSEKFLMKLGQDEKQLSQIKELLTLSTRLPHALINPVNLSPNAVPIVNPEVWPEFKECIEKVKQYDTLGIL